MLTLASIRSVITLCTAETGHIVIDYFCYAWFSLIAYQHNPCWIISGSSHQLQCGFTLAPVSLFSSVYCRWLNGGYGKGGGEVLSVAGKAVLLTEAIIMLQPFIFNFRYSILSEVYV